MWLKALSCVVLVGLTFGAEMSNESENCKQYNGKNYQVEAVKENIDRAYNLNIDRIHNQLFFSYDLPSSSNDVFAIGSIDLESSKWSEIEGARNGFATAVGPKGEIYVGNDRGIYMITNGQRADLIYEVGQDIWSMFYNMKHSCLVFVTWPDYEVHIFKDGKAYMDPSLSGNKVRAILSDSDDWVYFINATALYAANNVTKEVYAIDSSHMFRSMAFDNHEHLFVGAVDTLYVLNEDKKSLKKVADIPELYGMAFDRDNHFVYARNNGIYRASEVDSCPNSPKAPGSEAANALAADPAMASSTAAPLAVAA